MKIRALRGNDQWCSLDGMYNGWDSKGRRKAIDWEQMDWQVMGTLLKMNGKRRVNWWDHGLRLKRDEMFVWGGRESRLKVGFCGGSRSRSVSQS